MLSDSKELFIFEYFRFQVFRICKQTIIIAYFTFLSNNL